VKEVGLEPGVKERKSYGESGGLSGNEHEQVSQRKRDWNEVDGKNYEQLFILKCAGLHDVQLLFYQQKAATVVPGRRRRVVSYVVEGASYRIFVDRCRHRRLYTPSPRSPQYTPTGDQDR